MWNTKIIQEFEKLIRQKEHEYLKAPKKEQIHKNFSLRQTKKALQLIRDFPHDITEADLPELEQTAGIGKKTIQRIREILKNGKLSEIKSQKQIQQHLDRVEELEEVIGIGPRKAEELVSKHHVKSVEDLIKAHQKGKIELNEKVLLGLKYHHKYFKQIPRKEVMLIEHYLHQVGKKIDPELFVVICGSYRREKATSNDIDVLITHPKIKTASQLEKARTNYLRELVAHLQTEKFLLDDLTDKDYTTKYMGFGKYQKNPIRRVDIRYVPHESYYPALLYFTGSGNFNRQMREHAVRLGYKLNEYGLFKKQKDGKMKRIRVKSEKEIFNKLGLEYVSPPEREVV